MTSGNRKAPARKAPARKAPVREDNFQAPLGPHPSYDEIVDQAVEYTFPCSDPIAIQACCVEADRRARGRKDAGTTQAARSRKSRAATG